MLIQKLKKSGGFFENLSDDSKQSELKIFFRNCNDQNVTMGTFVYLAPELCFLNVFKDKVFTFETDVPAEV